MATPRMSRLQHASVAALITVACLVPVGANALDPLLIVRAFCQSDGDGDRLSPAVWRNIGQLVDWPLEPAWDRIILVSGYEITTPRRVGEDVEVELKYSVTAEVLPGKVVRKKREETLTLTLLPTVEGGWRVAGPPHPPHVFETEADPEALAELLQPSSSYQSNTAFIWHMLRENNWKIPYTVSTAIPDSPHFQEVGTAAPGDLVGYLTNGVPYHVGWLEADDSVLSVSLNAGRRSLPFAAFAGSIRYWRPREIETKTPESQTRTPPPAPLRRP